MAPKAKPQAEKKKRGRAVKHAPLWQLQDADFELNHWWMKSIASPGGGKNLKLNKEHPELLPLKDGKARQVTRAAPIVWEVLRRHPEIADLRKDLAVFLTPGPLHRVLFNDEAHMVIDKLGFGIELLLVLCGLNAWVSGKRRPSDWSALRAGACPLDGYPRIKFEQYMSAYCHGTQSPICIPSHEREVDIIAEARRFAQFLERRGIDETQSVDQKNPLSAITKEARELEMLRILLRFYATSGYRISIVAHHPSPVQHPASRFSDLDQPDADVGAIIYSEPEYPLFSTDQFSDLFGLVHQLAGKADTVSNFLFEKLPLKLRSSLEYFESHGRTQFVSKRELKLNAAVQNSQMDTKLNTGELRQVHDAWSFQLRMERMEGLPASLSEALNQILRGPSIYEPERFAGVTLPRETDALRLEKPTGNKRVRLNRLLLEAAYPNSIRPCLNEIVPGRMTTSGSAADVKRKPPERRPKSEQLTWVYEAERGVNTNQADYRRLLEGVRFPLLPCGADPDRKDRLKTRLERVTSELRKVTGLWPST